VGFGRVIIPSAQKQKNLLEKLQPHCFSALTLHKKCWSSDFGAIIFTEKGTMKMNHSAAI
jgi:hypothetical protein